MGNLDIFAQHTHLLITLFTLGVLFLSCMYGSSSQEKLFGPLWMIFIGLLLDFGSNGIAFAANKAFQAGGNIDTYVFLELTLSLSSMLLLLTAAMNLMIAGGSASLVGMILGVLGLAAIGAFVFLFPDGDIINNMRQIFPITGMLCLALGLWSKTGFRHKIGFLVSAMLITVMTIYLILKYFGIVYGSYWYISPVCYMVLSFAFLMMKIDSLYQKIEKNELAIAGYNKKIEEIIRLSPFPIVISRLSDDKIILANNNATKLFGINPNELDRYRVRDFFADSENRKLLNERLENEKEVQDFEILVKTPMSDTPFWLLASVNIIDYNYDVAMYAAFQDITSRKSREDLLKNQATKDPLTALYNRRYFEDEVTKQIAELKKTNQPYTVLMLDADKFKNINDTYGHKVGDKVLIELGATAEKALRDKDIVARYGGEEFVVFLPGIDADQGYGVADRLRQSIAEIVVNSDNNEQVKFTISIGVSSSDISDNVDVLVKAADEALYRAKQNGRNRVEVFSDTSEKIISELKPHKNEEENHHPIFDKENTSEISLIETDVGPKQGNHEEVLTDNEMS